MADAPIRLERDGPVAVLVLEDPPLNLVGSATFTSLNECLAQVEVSDARAMVWRAAGEVSTPAEALEHARRFEGSAPR